MPRKHALEGRRVAEIWIRFRAAVRIMCSAVVSVERKLQRVLRRGRGFQIQCTHYRAEKRGEKIVEESVKTKVRRGFFAGCWPGWTFAIG
jgi:hypothetical protein